MDSRIDGWRRVQGEVIDLMDGRRDRWGWTDREMVGWMDVQTDRKTNTEMFISCIVSSLLQLQPSQRRNPHRSQSWAS